MAEDIFDVVDEDNNVVSTAPRSVVHSLGLRHRAVHVVIYSKSEKGRKILLQKRSASKDLYPNLYTTSCSGHVDSGESYEVAVVREMKEETGLSVNVSELNALGITTACKETGYEFTKVYEFYCNEQTQFDYSKDEVADFEWVEEDVFLKLIDSHSELFTPSFLYVAKNVCTHFKRM